MPDSSSDHTLQLQQLSESLHDAFKSIAEQSSQHTYNRQRRASLPTGPILPAKPLSSLKRTVSHNSFPHLGRARVNSTPFYFSSAAAPPRSKLETGLHWSRSHINLQHIPEKVSAGRNRRGSLPVDFDSDIERMRRRPRRQSFPSAEAAVEQRHLHRCKASRKANITFEEIVRELTKARGGDTEKQIKEPSSNVELRRVKSEPALVKKTDRNEIKKIIEKQTSKSFHDTKSSQQVVHVHHIESRLVQSERRPSLSCRSTDFLILRQIRENVVS